MAVSIVLPIKKVFGLVDSKITVEIKMRNANSKEGSLQ
jgi:hypothetical protein